MNLIQAFRSWLIDDVGKFLGYQHISNGRQTRVVTDNSSSDVVGWAESLVVSKAQSKGIKVDHDSPTFTWRDMEGSIVVHSTGPGRPIVTAYFANVEDFAFAANDHYGPIKFHIPHDYVSGTDLFLHAHWSHNGTNVSGSLVIDHFITYAKGHGQAAFHAEKQLTQTVSGLNITNTPQYRHRLDELQLSISGGSSSQLDTDLIEPDGIIILHFETSTIPTITGGVGKPFIHYIDAHYLSTNIGTKQKAPDFYT